MNEAEQARINSGLPTDALRARESLENELKAKYKRVRIVDTAGGTIALRNPTRQEYRTFQLMLSEDDANVKATAFENLLLACVVSPDRAGMIALLDDYPALLGDRDIQQAMRELSGQVKSDQKKGGSDSPKTTA